ncbi:MAG: Gfo/Idh/MocA family oxidoreductase [Treponema sp.]|nr:Gfo/Idh/MocA family oxidoreductase [Treponema sp.]
MKEKLNWALVGTGGITGRFFEGLCAGGGNAIAVVSRNRERAQGFAADKDIGKAYGNYDQMLEDPAVHVVYIGTPHSTHKDLTVRALRAGKAVLCEKPCAINAEELREMIGAARENNCFFMEAMWTRYLPPLVKVREWLSQGLIGDVKIIQANFGVNAEFNPENRLFDINLGGGALLDLGIYPLSLISMVFEGQKPQDIKSQVFLGETGVDESTSALLSYGGFRIAFATAAIRTQLVNDAWIYGTKGRIHIPDFVWARTANLLLDGENEHHYCPEFISNGYNYEADEVMQCIRAGKTESSIMTWEESLTIMETMDTIRAQGNFRYPCE